MKTIRIDTYGGAYLVLDLDIFFPTTKTKLCALYKQFLKESKRDDVIPEIINYLREMKYHMKLEFSRYEMPELEMNKSTAYKRLCSNINQLKGYIK